MSKQWLAWWIVLGLGVTADAQTQVSLKTQARSADLSNVGPTKPMQTGTALPVACTTGQMFFLTTAPAGANLYACAATNVWSAIVGSGGGGVNVAAGSGIVVTQSGSTDTISTDPAVVPTKSVVQASTSNIVTLTSASSSALTGTQNPALAGYSDKQLVELTWNVACAGGPMTLAVDGLPATSLVKADGATALSAADCTSGQTNLFSYDGTLGKFKLLGGGAITGGGGSSVTFAPPYIQSGGNNYLPFGFQATLPPTSGWTALNFSGATLVTSGRGGAIAITSPLTGSLNLYSQTLPIGSTATLTGAVGFLSATGGGGTYCGVGIQNPTSGNLYTIAQVVAGAAAFATASLFNSPTSKNFDTAQVESVGSLTLVRMAYSGGTATAYVSTDGGASWFQVDQRTSLTGYTNWVFTSSGSSGGNSNCTLYSWSAQ